MRSSLETRLARLAVRNPYRTIALAVGMALLCILVIRLKTRIDSDILNLLPQRFDSVRALKVYDREFSQAHEITFALWDEKHESDLERFADYFGEELRKEPWVIRVMDRSPMESEEGVREIQKLAVPLLLNLPEADFSKALSQLKPTTIAERLARKRADIEAGSPRGEMELNFDPLGVVIPAMKPLAGSFSTDGPRPLASPDGTLRVAIAVTNQEGLDPESCQEMMRTVEAFKTRVVAGWEGPAPEILATGRTAYVSEMSLLMKDDIIATATGSVILVALIFYVAFRRLRPLLAIFHVLVFCCLAAVAAGTLIFDELNVVTMGICSIMVGIGVDFGMILFGTYQAARNCGQDHEAAATHSVGLLGRGILFGAATAATAFGSLILSESPGFAQLGVLIGIGVVIAALMMLTVFFALLGRSHKFAEKDFVLIGTQGYVNRLFVSPKPVALAGLAILILLNVWAYAPFGTVKVEANPRSLEPKNSKAGFALHKITSKVPAAEVEPVLAIIRGENGQEFHDQWQKAEKRWLTAKEKGEIKNFTSPAAFALSPERLKGNVALLSGIDFGASRKALTDSLEREGFAPDPFVPAFAMIDALEALSRGDLAPADWRRTLPPQSSWLFILDRFLSETPNVGVAYIMPNKTLASAAEQQQLRGALEVPGVQARLTGWSYVMADLVPWSKTKLFRLSLMMVLFITVVLAFLYRAVAPLVVLLLSLALSIGAMIAGLKITGLTLNLFNVLSFPLVLGIGIDYGIYIVLAVRQRRGPEALADVVKPVILSGLTTIAGFSSLGLANNPALSSLGLVCALGVACCLFSTLFLILPAYLWRGYR